MGNKIIRFECKLFIVGTLKHVNMFLELFQHIYMEREHLSSKKHDH